jgi:hypothetical protein
MMTMRITVSTAPTDPTVPYAVEIAVEITVIWEFLH